MAKIERTEKYFKMLIVISMLVQILDIISTLFPSMVLSFISAEFLTGSPEQINSTLAFANGIASIGMYFLFFIQYGADKMGRKPLLYLWVALTPISVLIWVLDAYLPTGTAFFIVLLGYSLNSISISGSLGIIKLITVEQTPTDRRGTAIGLRCLIASVGGTFGLLISSIAILSLGLGLTFIIFIMGNFILIPIAYFFLKETKGVDLSEIR